jgi:hypothetical protein
MIRSVQPLESSKRIKVRTTRPPTMDIAADRGITVRTSRFAPWPQFETGVVLPVDGGYGVA